MEMYLKVIIFHFVQLFILHTVACDLTQPGKPENLNDCLDLYLKAIPAQYGYNNKKPLDEVMGTNNEFCRDQVGKALFSIQQPPMTPEDVGLLLEVLIEYGGGFAKRTEDGQVSLYEKFARLLVDPGSFRCEKTLTRISEAKQEVECSNCNMRRYLDELEERNLSRCADDIRDLLSRKSDNLRGNFSMLKELSAKLEPIRVDDETLKSRLLNHIRNIVDKKKPSSFSRPRVLKETLYQVVEHHCQIINYTLGNFFQQFSTIMSERARLVKAMEKDEPFINYQLCGRLAPLVESIKEKVDRSFTQRLKDTLTD